MNSIIQLFQVIYFSLVLARKRFFDDTRQTAVFPSLLQKRDKVEEIKTFPSFDVKAGIGIVDSNN